jgi:hypothetical protein
MFTNEIGQPINPSTDYHAWKALLRRVGVRDARLHDAWAHGRDALASAVAKNCPPQSPRKR